MVVTVITQQNLYTPVCYLEESTAEGTIETSGTMVYIGPTVRFGVTHGQAKIISPGAGLEDVREAKYSGSQVSNTTIVYKVTDTNMLSYLVDAQDGSGTCEKSISLAATLKHYGSTKYWLAQFARPGFALFSSGRDLEIIGLGSFNHKFDLPLLDAWSSKPTLASDPGKTTNPSWTFASGGDNPVTWDGDDLDCENIRVMVDRAPVVRTSAGGTDLAVNICTARRVRYRMEIGNDANARKIIADYVASTAKELIWTLKTGSCVFTLADCILDPIPEEYLTAEEDPEVTLSLSGEAVSVTRS